MSGAPRAVLLDPKSQPVRNLCRNPSGEGASGWLANNGAITAMSWDTTVKRSGTRSRKSVVITAGVVCQSIYAAGFGGGGVGDGRYNCKGGDVISAGLWCRAGQLGYRSRPRLTFYDANGPMTGYVSVWGTYVEHTVVSNDPAVGWDLVKIEGYVAPAGAIAFHFGPQTETTNAAQSALGDCAWSDDAMVLIGASKLPEWFISGDQPDHRWTGVAHASEPVGYPYTLDRIAGRPLAWYDAQKLLGDGVALPADLTAVSQWVDLSGNGYHLAQDPGSRQPRFRSAQPNPIPYFDHPSWSIAASHTLDSNRVLNCGTSSQQSSIWVPVPFGATAMRIFGECQATGPGSGGTALSYMGANYYAADRVTQVANTSGNVANGNAAPTQPLPTDGSWTTRNAPFALGNSIRWARVDLSSFQTTPGVKWRNVWVQFTVNGVVGPAERVEPVDLSCGPVVQFDGVDDFLINSAIRLGLSDFSLYAVLRSDDDVSVSSIRAAFGYVRTGTGGVGSSQPGVMLYYRPDLGRPAPYAHRLFSDSLAFTSSSVDTPRDAGSRWAAYFQSRRARARRGPISGLTSAVAPTPVTGTLDGVAPNLVVGAGQVSSGGGHQTPSAVSIASLIIFDRDHDDTTRARVMDWLAQRHRGIAG